MTQYLSNTFFKFEEAKVENLWFSSFLLEFFIRLCLNACALISLRIR
jgi:hypothetical protein